MNSAENEPRLPTSLVPLEEAVISSQAVMVCRLADLGFTDFLGPGELGYDNAVFEVLTQLKGVPSMRVICSLRVKSFPPEKLEIPPEVGKDYILAGASAQGVFKIEKLVAATPSNIAEVKRLLGESIPIGRNIFKSVPTRLGTTSSVVATQDPSTAPAVPVPPALQTLAVTAERKASVWPWLFGIVALFSGAWFFFRLRNKGGGHRQ